MLKHSIQEPEYKRAGRLAALYSKRPYCYKQKIEEDCACIHCMHNQLYGESSNMSLLSSIAKELGIDVYDLADGNVGDPEFFTPRLVAACTAVALRGEILEPGEER